MIRFDARSPKPDMDLVEPPLAGAVGLQVAGFNTLSQISNYYKDSDRIDSSRQINELFIFLRQGHRLSRLFHERLKSISDRSPYIFEEDFGKLDKHGR